ncbi:MAG TPA: ABC transporter permease [Candidatus Acidoferrales bacterium]
MHTFMQDARYALRMLLKSPGFTLIAIITLALGIGANAAIFSVVYVSLLRPLPYSHSEQLVTLAESRLPTSEDAFNVSYPDLMDWRKMTRSFQSLTAYGFDAFTFSGNGDPKNVFAAQVLPNFFSTLGVKPMLGRDFVDGEDKPDGPYVVILSYRTWRSDFGGDPNVIGRSYRIDNKPVTIIGVLPKAFEFAPAGQSSAMWVPMHAEGDLVERRSLRWMNGIARFAPGTSAKQAQADLDAVTAQLDREYPGPNANIHVVMVGLREKIVGQVRPLLLILTGTVAFVLLIACANLANLLMARSVGRQKEFAIRAAMGATRIDLIRQLLTESLMLSFLGAAAGILVAQWGVSALIAAIPVPILQSLPYLRDAGMNLPVLLFLVCVTLLTGTIFGLAPGLAVAESTVGEILKEDSRGATSGTHARLRNAFVTGEIAICLVLLVGAGLMVRSFRSLVRKNPGFDAHNVLTFAVNLPDYSYPSQKDYPFSNPTAIRFAHQYTDALRALPGVVSVGISSSTPTSGGGGTVRFVVEGRPVQPGKEDEAQIRGVDSGYFAALKIPLVEGRFFNDFDKWESAPVVVVNQAFVKRYFPGEDVIGKRMRLTFNPKTPYMEIVGVVGDTADIDLASAPPPILYMANDQGPNTFAIFLVRTAGDPSAFVGAVRAALRQLDPQLAVIIAQPLEQVANDSPAVFLRRYPSYLIGIFAILALILAITGLHGLISYSVVQRTREIGIRMALGAQSGDVISMILRQGIAAVVAGIAIGIIAALALTRLMASLLYGVTPTDALTFGSVALILIAVAISACVMPAMRATRVDPIEALRHE